MARRVGYPSDSSRAARQQTRTRPAGGGSLLYDYVADRRRHLRHRFRPQKRRQVLLCISLEKALFFATTRLLSKTVPNDEISFTSSMHTQGTKWNDSDQAFNYQQITVVANSESISKHQSARHNVMTPSATGAIDRLSTQEGNDGSTTCLRAAWAGPRRWAALSVVRAIHRSVHQGSSSGVGDSLERATRPLLGLL